jgi:DNA-binding transcriptional LysR family regulator
VLPIGLPPHLLTPLFGALRTTYPQLRVHARFSDDPLGEPLDDVDMAVHFGEALPKGPWLSHVMLRVREGLIASQEYLRRRGTPRSVEELQGHELFSWEAPGEDARLWPTLRGVSFRVEPALIATDVHFIRSCCLAGLGIGLVPSIELADPDTPAELLVPVLPDVVGRERPVRISVPEALSEIPKVKHVLAHIQGFLAPL